MLSYPTITHHVSHEIPKIKGSTFIGDLFPVSTKAEADACLDQIRKLHHTARHRCYGYHIGVDTQCDMFETRHISPREKKYNDDGEPGSTASGPIKTILTHSGLQNVLLIITRYFGGTLLGVGGLISAYTDAAKAVVEKATVTQIPLTKKLAISYTYDQTGTIHHFCTKHNITISQQTANDNGIDATLDINLAVFEQIKKELTALGIADLSCGA